MRKHIVFLFFIAVLTGCKTTPEDYSNYAFIGDNVKSNYYEVLTLVPDQYELKNMLGYTLTRGMFSPELEKKTWDMPLIYFNKKKIIYYIVYDRKNSVVHYVRYNISSHKKDTIKNEDSLNTYKQIFQNNYEKSHDLINFKFPQAEKYYKVIEEKYHSEISEKEKNEALEEYKDSSEEIKQAIIEIRSIRYNTIYSELQMPKEKIKFKFNSYENKKIEFFGNEDLYKKGYIYVYIYNKLSLFPHSGGLYVIRPKAIK